MKRIEKGCQAIVMGSRCPENNGKAVVVGDPIPLGIQSIDGIKSTITKHGWWYVDRPMKVKLKNTQMFVDLHIAHESKLVRIDPDENMVQEMIEESYEEYLRSIEGAEE